jgi:hypothetical protein
MGWHASRQVLESAYDQENDGEVKARILLVMRVKVDGVRPAHAVKELHSIWSFLLVKAVGRLAFPDFWPFLARMVRI